LAQQIAAAIQGRRLHRGCRKAAVGGEIETAEKIAFDTGLTVAILRPGLAAAGLDRQLHA